MYSRQAGRKAGGSRGGGRAGGSLVLLNKVARFTSLIMQTDVLRGELWYQHVASDMGSGPQGQF